MNKRTLLFTITGLLLISGLVVGAYMLGIQKGSTSATKPNQLVTVSDNYKKQLPQLEAAVKNDSNDPKALREYAVALYASGDLDKAKQQYEEEIQLNKSNATTYNNLGNIARQKGNFNEAISLYEKAIQMDEKNIPAYLNLGHIYVNSLNNLDKAVEIYTNALTKNPNTTALQSPLAMAYERNGNKTQAKQVYTDILSHDANNTVAQEAVKRLEKTK